MTRTHSKHIRVYCDGVDLSGYSRQVGALNWMFDAEKDASLTDEAADASFTEYAPAVISIDETNWYQAVTITVTADPDYVIESGKLPDSFDPRCSLST